MFLSISKDNYVGYFKCPILFVSILIKSLGVEKIYIHMFIPTILFIFFSLNV